MSIFLPHDYKTFREVINPFYQEKLTSKNLNSKLQTGKSVIYKVFDQEKMFPWEKEKKLRGKSFLGKFFFL